MRRSFTSRLSAAFLLVLATGSVCYCQTPVQLKPGTPVIGKCAGHESEPGCVLPDLFGSEGLTVYADPKVPHYAHFIGSAQTTLNQTLSSAIATQLAILPIISPASGFTYRFNKVLGVFERSSTSFGPIYSERAETIGRGQFFFGVSYQRFRFGSIDGLNLHDIPAVYGHVDPFPTETSPYRADVIQSSTNIDLKMDQTMLYTTVGITDRIDVSVALPIVSVRMSATSNAQIVRVSGNSFTANGQTFNNPHRFDAAGDLSKVFTSSGDATGIGDVTFRFKANVYRGEAFYVTAATDVRAPTGDALRLLGSGALGLKPFIAVSMAKRFSPHVNLGYEWNGNSILAGDVTGVTAAGADTIVNGPRIKRALPGVLLYSAGADVGATRRLTLVFDYLGQTLINARRVFRSQYVTQSVPGGIGSQSLDTITGGRDTVALSNAATGLKFNPFGRLLITANLMYRIDNRGLRQNVTPLIGVSYGVGP